MRGVCQGVRARSRRGRGIRWMMLVEKWHWWKPLQYSENKMISDGHDEAFRGENPKRRYMDHCKNARRKKGGNIWRLGIIVPLHPMLRIEYQVLKSTLAGYSEKYRAF